MSMPGCCCFFSQVGVWQTEEGRERMWCPKPFYIACWHRCSICAQDQMTEQSARRSFVAKLHRWWHCSLIRHPETNIPNIVHINSAILFSQNMGLFEYVCHASNSDKECLKQTMHQLQIWPRNPFNEQATSSLCLFLWNTSLPKLSGPF